jgi:hypothetical protein
MECHEKGVFTEVAGLKFQASFKQQRSDEILRLTGRAF